MTDETRSVWIVTEAVDHEGETVQAVFWTEAEAREYAGRRNDKEGDAWKEFRVGEYAVVGHPRYQSE